MGPYCECNECWWCLEHGKGSPWPGYPKKDTMYKFDFDEWADLYERDPAEFERKRRQVLDAEIQKAPVEQRLRLKLIQLECDVYHTTLDPMEATAKMTEMLIKKAKELKGPLTSLREILEDAAESNK